MTSKALAFIPFHLPLFSTDMEIILTFNDKHGHALIFSFPRCSLFCEKEKYNLGFTYKKEKVFFHFSPLSDVETHLNEFKCQCGLIKWRVLNS